LIQDAAPNRPTVEAVRIEKPPVIDGRLDDEVWSRARPTGDFVQVDPVEHAQVVVPDEADSRPLADDLDHLVGPRPVADEVAEAPQLVRRVGVDRLEDGLERV